MLVTGHLAEWLEYLPPALQPGREVYNKSLAWVSSQITAFRPSEIKMEDLCPWTHCMCALRNVVAKATTRPDTQTILAGIGRANN